MARSARFQQAAGIADDPAIIQKFVDLFLEMRQLIATQGGAAGRLPVKGETGSSFGLALPLGGWFKPLAVVHELGHIAREASKRVKLNESVFALEEALKKHDPKFWHLWFTEEMGAWRTTLNYFLRSR